MRLVRISLAFKYRILFALAVLLIIGAALFVPWYRMEQLVWEQHFREVQRIAREYFRTTLAASDPTAVPTGPHADESLGPLPRRPHQTRFVRGQLPLEGGPGNLPSTDDPFVARALVSFTRKPDRESSYEVRRTGDGWHFLYAEPVRVTTRCLSCHSEGAGRATPYREHQLAGVIAVDMPLDISETGLVVNRIVIMTAGALAGVLAILVFYIITKRFILAPIDGLRDVAARVTAGDLASRATVKTGDEFEQLSDSLNAMLERLRLSQEDLQKANRLLDEKLDEMAQSNIALFEANRVKSEFIANVSHELRTPLTSIIGFAELLREGPQTDGSVKIQRYAENILISGRILLEIINDLLDLAKIEAGRVELRLEPVNLADLCSTLIDFTRPLADKKNLRIDLWVDEDVPELTTDRGRLRQVLFNFVSNAIKFTPEEGQISIAVQKVAGQRVQVSVQDTGPGIDAEHQALIFEKFRQIDQSATREHHGTGLGLAIARELTFMLGGEIGVLSEPGSGATFWVRFPMGTPTPRERPPISLV